MIATVLSLATLGFGFKIYMEASTPDKKKFRKLGRAVGVFIMIMSLLSVLCGTFHIASDSGYCPMAKKSGWMCPFTSKAKI